jgi:hypothetical protein
MIEDDGEGQAEAVVGREFRPLVAVLDATAFLTRMNFLAAFCSSMPADWMRKTKGAALPSMMGISAASTSTQDVVDAQAGEGRHQMLDGGDLGAVLFQAGGQARVADGEGIGRRSTGGSRSTRRKTMPVSVAAGRRSW